MKKIFLILILVTTFFTIDKVDAASANISIWANKSRVIVGETVTVTVKVSSSSALGSWSFDMSKSSNLSYVSSSFGGATVIDYGNASTYSKTYTFTYKAISSGSAKVSVVNQRVVDFNTATNMTSSGASVYFTTMTQAELEATYSKNNNLSSLEVEGYTLTPEFDSDVLDYSLVVENDVRTINIIASKEDSTATLNGGGEVQLIEGENLFPIKVTAQNGSVKTYNLKVTVKELIPIEVVVNNTSYTVVRKQESLPTMPDLFEPKTIMIDTEEVLAYYNELNNITLVALQTETGEVSLFQYFEDTYIKYEELKFEQNYIIPLEFDNELEGFTKTNVKIGDISVLGYVKDGYPLIYGLNINTGEKHIYSYDETENTVQKYLIIEEKVDNTLLYIIYGLSGFIALTYLVIIIKKITRKKTKYDFFDETSDEVTKMPKETVEKIKKEKVKKEKVKKEKIKKEKVKKEKIEKEKHSKLEKNVLETVTEPVVIKVLDENKEINKSDDINKEKDDIETFLDETTKTDKITKSENKDIDDFIEENTKAKKTRTDKYDLNKTLETITKKKTK